MGSGDTDILPPPKLLAGKYRLLRKLGSGGMGMVYEAENVDLGRRVAVKVLDSRFTLDSSMRLRFEREARAAAAVDHPHIVAVHDLGCDDDGSAFIVMELLSGETLGARLAREGTLPLERAVSITAQILAGLGAAHEQGIVHRDLKPENVFLVNRAGWPDSVKLLDFGISKFRGTDRLAGGADTDVTVTGQILGTPRYMSPEQAAGRPDVDHRADLYAAATLLYQMLAGRAPFRGANSNAVLAAILTETPVPLATLRPDLPAELAELVMRGMARQPAQRFPDAASFTAALLGCAELNLSAGGSTPMPFVPLAPPPPLPPLPGKGIESTTPRPATPRPTTPSQIASPATTPQSATPPPAAPQASTPQIDTPRPTTAEPGTPPPATPPASTPGSLTLGSGRRLRGSGPPGSDLALLTESMDGEARLPLGPAADPVTVDLRPPLAAAATAAGEAQARAPRPGWPRPGMRWPLGRGATVAVLLTLVATAAVAVWLRSSATRGRGTEPAATRDAGVATRGPGDARQGPALRWGVMRFLPRLLSEVEAQPFLEYLQAQLHMPVQHLLFEDLGEVAAALRQERVDLLTLPPLGYVKLKAEIPSVQLFASHVADGASTYQGLIVTRLDVEAPTLAALRGRSFCYVNPTSASGYLYPRALLRRQGIDPDRFFGSFHFAGDHLAVLRAIRDRACDVGAIYAPALYASRDVGLNPGAFRIVASTERIPYEAYVLRAGLAAELGQRIRQAVLALGAGKAEALKLGGKVSHIDGFIAVDDHHYDSVRAIAAYMTDTRPRGR